MAKVVAHALPTRKDMAKNGLSVEGHPLHGLRLLAIEAAKDGKELQIRIATNLWIGCHIAAEGDVALGGTLVGEICVDSVGGHLALYNLEYQWGHDEMVADIRKMAKY